MRKVTKLARQIGTAVPLKQYVKEAQYPGTSVQADAGWESFLKQSSGAEFHPVRSCSLLLLEQGGVVEGSLKVYGLANVGIVDASIIPVELSSHTGSPAYTIAELAAQIVKKRNAATDNRTSATGSPTQNSASSTSSSGSNGAAPSRAPSPPSPASPPRCL